MTDKGLYISPSLKAFQKETGIGLLSLLNSKADGWRAGAGNPLIAMKTHAGSSLREMLAQSDYDSEAKADNLLRDKLVYWDQFFNQNPVARRNPVFARLIEAFNDKAFTGVLVFDLSVADFPKKEICGNPELLSNARFCAPFFQIRIPRESRAWQMAKASTWGFLSLCEPVAFPMENCTQTGFSLERTDVLLEDGSISCSGAVCRALVTELFSTEVSGDPYLTLYGAYELAGASAGQGAGLYHFVLLSNTRLYPSCSAASLVLLESLESSVSVDCSGIGFRLSCNGRLHFKTAGALFDPFSYGGNSSKPLTGSSGASSAPQQEGLPFSGLTLTYDIAGGRVRNSRTSYRTFMVHAEQADSRANSFAKSFSGNSCQFLCWETTPDPKSLGYLQIAVPSKQSKLEQHWYGLCFPVTLTKEVNLKFLFAWSATGNTAGFYSGALVEAFGSPKKLKITVGSLFHLGFQSVMVQSEQVKGGIRYVILLKGLSVGMLGLSMPQNACDITLMSGEDENRGPCKAWISVYGKDSEKEEKAHGREVL